MKKIFNFTFLIFVFFGVCFIVLDNIKKIKPFSMEFLEENKILIIGLVFVLPYLINLKFKRFDIKIPAFCFIVFFFIDHLIFYIQEWSR